MKKKLRLAGLSLILHLIISGVLWGCLIVYQRGYNTMHRDGIAVASVRVAEDRMQVSILEKFYTFPSAWLEEDSALYFAAYALTDTPLHLILQMLSVTK